MHVNRIGKIPNTKLEKKEGSWIYCSHPNLLSIEFKYGRRCFNDSGLYIDWHSNQINAHVSRVTKVYCPICGCQFSIPSDTPDKLPEKDSK